MKKFFSQLFGGKSSFSHHTASAWLDELAELSDINALQLSTKKLAASIDEESLGWLQKQDLLLLLENLNQPRLERITTQFVSVENLKSDLEAIMQEAGYQYCRQVYISHLKVVEKTLADQNQQSALLIARTINAAGQMIKWRMFGQAPLPAKVWLQLHSLLKLTQRKNLLSQEVVLFEGYPSTTLAASFVQIFMLGQLIQSSLPKQPIEIASKILAHWLPRVHLSNIYSPDQYVFFVNLEEDEPARRMRAFMPESECRYWELDDFEKQVGVALAVLERGELPESLISARIDNRRALESILRTLQKEWSKSSYVRQRRREPRRATSKTAKVSAGIAHICERVRNTNRVASGQNISIDGKSLDDRLLSHTTLRQPLAETPGQLDIWIVSDESNRGLGMRASKFASVTAKVGKLIAVTLEDDPGRIILGQIKAVKATSGNQLRVSVETLSQHPAWAQLQIAISNESFANTGGGEQPEDKYRPRIMDMGLFSAIYLPIEAGISTSSALIVPKVNFLPNQYYLVNLHGNTTRVRLEKPVDTMDDWVRVTFPF